MLMAEEYRNFDASAYVRAAEDLGAFLEAASEEDSGDGVAIRAALKHVARTQNMSAVARGTGSSRSDLHEALSDDGNPTLATLFAVTRALGLRTAVRAGRRTGGNSAVAKIRNTQCKDRIIQVSKSLHPDLADQRRPLG